MDWSMFKGMERLVAAWNGGSKVEGMTMADYG
jgi:hypothetical protein